MADPKMRIRLPGTGPTATRPNLPAVTVSAGQKASVGQYYSDILPAKEWCIVDDMLTVSDSMSFTVANPDGINTDKFQIGRRVEADISDENVAGGNWLRAFTGRVVNIDHSSDTTSGSTLRVDCMDLGWHLTSCCARPLQNTNGITYDQLLGRLIDPSWGFAGTTATGGASVVFGNAHNKKLKQGRTGFERQYQPPKTILPYIQVEPGQTPWSILQQYAAREGLLVNVGVNGELILFQPDYTEAPPYAMLEYHSSRETARVRNNVVSVSKIEKLDGVYSETQCWSTVVLPQKTQAAEDRNDPNAQYRHASFTPPSGNPLPFYRLKVDMDAEAINPTMRKMRAQWRLQMDAFNSWEYTVEVNGHSSKNPNLFGPTAGGSFFWASDSMVSVNDTVHNVSGTFYIQRVQRSFTMKGGPRSRLTLRRPYLLDPSLAAQTGGVGGGAIKAGTATHAPTSTTTVGPGGQVTVIPKVQ